MTLDWIRFGEPLNIGMVAVRIAVAVLISAVIGIDREVHNRPAGMRTHVLVCLGACIIAMLEQQIAANATALASPAVGVSFGRITAAVISGIGFLGAGTIVMSDRRITGLTTAASLWCTACLGAAVGFGYTTMALIAGVVVLVVLKLMQKVVRVTTYKRLEVQFVHRGETIAFLNDYFAKMGAQVLDVDFHAETKGSGNVYTNIYTLIMPSRTSYAEIIAYLSENPNIRAVRTRNV